MKQIFQKLFVISLVVIQGIGICSVSLGYDGHINPPEYWTGYAHLYVTSDPVGLLTYWGPGAPEPTQHDVTPTRGVTTASPERQREWGWAVHVYYPEDGWWYRKEVIADIGKTTPVHFDFKGRSGHGERSKQGLK
ncbi:MAG: hypothetical protein KJ967_04955 [Elusimicrobia bacterium]|nr:hypothetical protein [Elusimicrobiota bacterium]